MRPCGILDFQERLLWLATGALLQLQPFSHR